MRKRWMTKLGTVVVGEGVGSRSSAVCACVLLGLPLGTALGAKLGGAPPARLRARAALGGAALCRGPARASSREGAWLRGVGFGLG